MSSVEILPVGDQIQPSASLQLFAFPHAGGHTKTFENWDHMLDQVNVSVDMYCASYPSRSGGVGNEKVKMTFGEVVCCFYFVFFGSNIRAICV